MADYEDFLPAERLSGFDMALSLSADGTMVAYSSDASGQFNVQVRPVDGGPARVAAGAGPVSAMMRPSSTSMRRRIRAATP